MKPYEFLFLRQLPFDYISPPICESLFSGSGEPTILLEAFDNDPVVGVEWEWDGNNFSITNTAYPGAICYSVYRVEGDPPTYVLVAECVETITIPECLTPPCCYVITAITPEGETPPSEEFCPEVPDCPVWATALPASENVVCGNDIVFVAEATTPNGTDITYTWVNPDGVVVFQETKASGASTYTKVAADEDDDGVWTVTADDGLCEITSDDAVTVIGCNPGPCGNSDDMSTPPTHFLIKLDPPEPPLQTWSLGVPKDNTGQQQDEITLVDKGIYLLRYTGGAAGYSCDHDRNLGNLDYHFRLYPGAILIEKDTGSGYNEETSDWVIEEWDTPTNYYGLGALGNNFAGAAGDWSHPYDSIDYTSEGDIEMVFMPQASPVEYYDNFGYCYESAGAGASIGNNAELQPGTKIRVSFAHAGGCDGTCDGSGNGLICNPDGCCGGTWNGMSCDQQDACETAAPPQNCGTCRSGSGSSWEFLRWGYWLDEPNYIRIVNVDTAFKNALTLCGICNAAPGWATDFAGEFQKIWYQDDSLIYVSRNIWADDAIRGIDLDQSSNKLSKTKVYWDNGVWYCDVYCKTSGSVLWWRGKKTVGQTAVGVYDRDPSDDGTASEMCSLVPACIVIEEFTP